MSAPSSSENRRAAIRRATTLLAEAGIADARLEARDLLLFILGIERPALDAALETPLSAAEHERFDAAITRRLAGTPLDRIMGSREFMGRLFRLNAQTLSPREDSAAVIDLARRRFPSEQALSVLDLGTGSGILLVTLLAEFAQASGLGTDLAQGALDMAALNAEALGVSARAWFQRADWFSGVEGEFDLIVSNPPYIESAILPTLEREVREHDPRLALDGGADGLAAYRVIAAGAARVLAPAGVVIVEIGQGQGEAVRALFSAAGLASAGMRADLSGIERALAFEHGAQNRLD